MEAYGLSETSAAVSLDTPAHHRFGSVGRVLPDMEARFAEDGELLVRGPNVFGGYLRDPQATAERARRPLAAHGRRGPPRRRRAPLHHGAQEGF